MADDWQVYVEERGIAEFRGSLPRPEAAPRALAGGVSECLNRNPVRSQPGWSEWHEGLKAPAVAAVATMGVKERSDQP